MKPPLSGPTRLGQIKRRLVYYLRATQGRTGMRLWQWTRTRKPMFELSEFEQALRELRDEGVAICTSGLYYLRAPAKERLEGSYRWDYNETQRQLEPKSRD
jgi:hypothetical protein